VDVDGARESRPFHRVCGESEPPAHHFNIWIWAIPIFLFHDHFSLNVPIAFQCPRSKSYQATGVTFFKTQALLRSGIMTVLGSDGFERNSEQFALRLIDVI
jgi:hypothetical protein